MYGKQKRWKFETAEKKNDLQLPPLKAQLLFEHGEFSRHYTRFTLQQAGAEMDPFLYSILVSVYSFFWWCSKPANTCRFSTQSYENTFPQNKFSSSMCMWNSNAQDRDSYKFVCFGEKLFSWSAPIALEFSNSFSLGFFWFLFCVGVCKIYRGWLNMNPFMVTHLVKK